MNLVHNPLALPTPNSLYPCVGWGGDSPLYAPQITGNQVARPLTGLSGGGVGEGSHLGWTPSSSHTYSISRQEDHILTASGQSCQHGRPPSTPHPPPPPPHPQSTPVSRYPFPTYYRVYRFSTLKIYRTTFTSPNHPVDQVVTITLVQTRTKLNSHQPILWKKLPPFSF